MVTQSLRATRTIGNKLRESSEQNIRQSLSDPMNLKISNTDDSSVFSGLRNSDSDEKEENKTKPSVRFESEDAKAKQSKRKSSNHKTQIEGIISRGSDLFGSISEEEEPHESSAVAGKGSDSRKTESQKPNAMDPDFLDNQDASAFSYGSVNDFQRPTGIMKLVSDIQLLGGADSESKSGEDFVGREPPQTPEGSEAITNLLKEFERELDANLSSISDDQQNDNRISSHEQYVPSRIPQSDDDPQQLSNFEVNDLRSLLQQTRKEVQILKDNNEQLLSEIEQTEEEHRSEIKLVEERSKQKLFELKGMYQEEMDALTQEKDAAIEEAGRRAAQYADSGRKEISILRKQIEKLKLHTIEAVKKAAGEAGTMVKTKKNIEITSRIEVVRKSYEIKLEQMRQEYERKVQSAVDRAVVSTSRKMSEDRKSNMIGAAWSQSPESVDEATSSLKQENDDIQKKQEAMLNALLSVKDHLNRRYPEQMESLGDKTRHTSNSRVLPRTCDHEESRSETLFKEIVEAFAYLLEEGDKKLACAQTEVTSERAKKERHEVYLQARGDLIAKHRAELEYTKHLVVDTRKEAEQFKEKLVRLEHDFKIASREKRALQERFRKDSDTHRNQVKRLQEKIQELEKEGNHKNPFQGARERRRARDALETIRYPDMQPAATPRIEQSEERIEDPVNDQGKESIEEDEFNISSPGSSNVNEFSCEMHYRSFASIDEVESCRSPTTIVDEESDTPFDCSSLGNHEYRRDEKSIHQFHSYGEDVAAMLTPPPSPPPPPPQRPSLTLKNSRTQKIGLTRIASADSSDDGSFSNRGGIHGGNEDDEMKGGLGEHGKKKTFGLLRGLKSIRSITPTKLRNPSTSTQDRQPERNADALQTPRVKVGRVGMIRNFFDTIGKSDSSHRRREFFFEDSPSSQTEATGIMGSQPGSAFSSCSVKIRVEENRSLNTNDIETGCSEDESFSEHTRSSMKNKENTLRLLAKKTQPSSSTEDSEEKAEPSGGDTMSVSKEHIPPQNSVETSHGHDDQHTDTMSQKDLQANSRANESSPQSKGGMSSSEPINTTQRSIEGASSVTTAGGSQSKTPASNCNAYDPPLPPSPKLSAPEDQPNDVGDDSINKNTRFKKPGQDENKNSFNDPNPNPLKPALISITHKYKTSDRSSTPRGSSQATTPVSSDYNNLRELGRRTLSSPTGVSSTRRATTVAALKARRSRRQAEIQS